MTREKETGLISVPNFRTDREYDQYLNAPMKRVEVEVALKDLRDEVREQFSTILAEALGKLGEQILGKTRKEMGRLIEVINVQTTAIRRIESGTNMAFGLSKENGLQLTAACSVLKKLFDDFEPAYKIEMEKFIKFTQFLESLGGVDPNGVPVMSPPARIQAFRDWNAVESNIPVKPDHIDMEGIIRSWPDYTWEERKALSEEFNLSLENLIPEPREEVVAEIAPQETPQ